MRFLDTNIILRYLLNDDKEKAKACFELFSQIAKGETLVWTSDLVIAEVVFVLSNKKTYGYSRAQIEKVLYPLLQLPNIVLANKARYKRIFDLYINSKIDFIDCYHAAFIEHLEDSELYSYDLHFDQIQGISRIEPSPPQEDED